MLSDALRISEGEAKRRITQAELLGPRTALTGETLPPKLPNVAAAQARGEIGAEHLKIIERLLRRSAQPHRLPDPRIGRGRPGTHRDWDWGRRNFGQAADRLALLLNQDGDLPDDADRARRRYLTIEKQGIDGMSRIHGLLDPEARATR